MHLLDIKCFGIGKMDGQESCFIDEGKDSTPEI
jgi:hypothetical protein